MGLSSMEISDDVLQALDACVSKAGSVSQFSRDIGVSHTTVERWLSGATSNINRVLWKNNVYPALKPYLNETPPPAARRGIQPRPPQQSVSYRQNQPDAKMFDAMKLLIDQKLNQLFPDQIVKVVNFIDQIVEENRERMIKESLSVHEKAEEFGNEEPEKCETK